MKESNRLPRSFYTQQDVLTVSKKLLGKSLLTHFEGQLSAGIITETEAYRGKDDKACHAYNGRRTARTEVMYGQGGIAYVYLCYGIHHLVNVVVGPKEQADAVLIRAIIPQDNIPLILQRRKKDKLKPQLCVGPGVLTQALGIKTAHSGMDLCAADSKIWIEDRGIIVKPSDIIESPRVGIDYAEECVDWDWRFRIKPDVTKKLFSKYTLS